MESQYVIVLTVPDDSGDIDAACRDLNDLLKVSGALMDASARPLSEILAC